MGTNIDVFEAVVDAVIADPTINQGAAQDAVRTVATLGVSDLEAAAWLDELEALYNSLGLINNNTWAPFRNKIANDGKPVAMALFTALASSINALPADAAIQASVQKLDLREDRDNVDAALDRCDVLIAAEPGGTVGRLIKEVLRNGKQELRAYKQRVIEQLQSIGDV